MNELIKVDINKEDYYESTVSARRIHKLLGAKQAFTNWFKYHAKNMKLVEGVHYTKVASDRLTYQKSGRGGDRKSVDYIVPVRIAEHLCMASRTPMSYKIRDHFIDIKNRYFAERAAEIALWNDPDYVIPRALEISHRALQISQKRVSDLRAKYLADAPKKDYFDKFLE